MYIISFYCPHCDLRFQAETGGQPEAWECARHLKKKHGYKDHMYVLFCTIKACLKQEDTGTDVFFSQLAAERFYYESDRKNLAAQREEQAIEREYGEQQKAEMEVFQAYQRSVDAAHKELRHMGLQMVRQSVYTIPVRTPAVSRRHRQEHEELLTGELPYETEDMYK